MLESLIEDNSRFLKLLNLVLEYGLIKETRTQILVEDFIDLLKSNLQKLNQCKEQFEFMNKLP